jgi:hypothetical protein
VLASRTPLVDLERELASSTGGSWGPTGIWQAGESGNPTSLDRGCPKNLSPDGAPKRLSEVLTDVSRVGKQAGGPWVWRIGLEIQVAKDAPKCPS